MNEMSTKFQLTADNYYSDEANREYLSVSQFKDFVGTYGRMGCEEMALAKIRGEYKTEPSNAMMIGSYVDSYYEGTLDEFRTKNPQIFRKDGKLLSGFQKAEDIIARTERDELFQKYMSGKKQVIMTAELFGVPWKIKMDSYLEDKSKLLAALRMYDTFYLYDPFRGETFKKVIKNIEESVRRKDRNVTIVYANPWLHREVEAGGVFKLVKQISTEFFLNIVNVYENE